MPPTPQDTRNASELVDAIEKLRTRLIDAVAGYDEALEHAEPDVAPTLRTLRGAHEREIERLVPVLTRLHGDTTSEGSWMTPVQKAVMNARAWLTGIDEGVIPAVVRGERSLLALYDDAIGEAAGEPDVLVPLADQRAELARLVDALEARGRAAGR